MKGLCLQRHPEGRAGLSHARAEFHDTAINRLTLPSDGSARTLNRAARTSEQRTEIMSLFESTVKVT